MPRAESTKSTAGTQPYRSVYDASPSPSSSPSAGASAAKKKHVCPTCERSFTTSGHLARHSRIHTGERNHKCPFPGCETRCSRQDNLQQHYRIHLSPGSRRSSARSRATVNVTKRARAASTVSTDSVSSAPHPPVSPPPLDTGRLYSHEATPPVSPPPLAHATLPATAHLHGSSSSPRSSLSASPEASYASLSHNLLSMSSSNVGISASAHQYSYRMNCGYQDESPNTNYGYGSLGSSTSPNGDSFSSYVPNQDYPTQQTHLSSSSLHQVHTRDTSPGSNLSSRHSISHISHPQSYSQSTLSPPSPASSQSVSSHASCPPTPTYPVYSNEGAHVAVYHHHGVMSTDSHLITQTHLAHGNYSIHADGRFESPPPTLAPIHDPRYAVRRESVIERHVASHQTSYLHHPQPMTSDFGYQSLNMGPVTWKPEPIMRKGLGALVG